MKGKGISRVLSCVLTLCLACTGMFCFPVTKAHADPIPVKLYSAQYQYADGYTHCVGDICIANLSSTKVVTVHYTRDGANWYDSAASYVKADGNNPGYEVWRFDLSAYSTPLVQSFVIRYDVNGQTYWDNNNGNNYSFGYSVPDALILENSTVLGIPTLGIFVKNIAYTKVVGVRYSTDNWATYTDVNASYRWAFNSAIDCFTYPSIPSGAKYAIYYTVNGVTYWDNNYGSNYTA